MSLLDSDLFGFKQKRFKRNVVEVLDEIRKVLHNLASLLLTNKTIRKQLGRIKNLRKNKFFKN